MTELTLEKWDELNGDLSGELEQAEGRARSTSRTAMRFGITAAVVVVGTAVLAIIIRPAEEEAMYFMPAGAAFGVAAWLFLRALRIKGLAQNEVERIQRDIRQWKKRKPGSVFDQARKQGLSQSPP